MPKQYLFTETKDADAPLRVDSVEIRWETDISPNLDFLRLYEESTDPEEQKYAVQDHERLRQFERGTWEMRGCTAIATVSYSIGQGSRRIETFSSGGLWGIESDSEASYLAEVESEQVADLREHLARFGVTLPAELPATAGK